MIRKLLLTLALLLVAPVAANAAARFAVCSTTCTWDGTSTAMWSASSGGATGASVPGSGDTVTFDANTCVGGTTCTTTVNTTVTIQSLTFGACTASTAGCIIDFSVNNNNVNIVNAGGVSLFSGTGTGTRTLNMGTGTWTVGSSALGSSASITFLTTTGLTLTPQPALAPIVLISGSLASTNLFFGGKSWGPLTITGSSTYPATYIQFEAGNPVNDTFGSLTVNAPAFIVFRSGQTFTFTGGITCSGGSWSKPIAFMGDNPSGLSSNTTLAAGSASACPYSTWRNVAGATSAITANPAVNLGGNGGTLAITNPGTGGGGYIIGQ